MCASLLWVGASAFNLKRVTAPEDKEENSLLRGRHLILLDHIEVLDVLGIEQADFTRNKGKGTGSKGSKSSKSGSASVPPGLEGES